jgi:hypothetical protein
MKDTQNDIFTAFIVALFQQTESLPLEIQSEFNKIDETSPVTDILRLTKLHSPLLVAYKNNRIWLTKHSKQRNQKTAYNSDTAKQNATNTEIDKPVSDISALTNLLNFIDRIDPEVKQRGLRSVLENMLQSRDSVQASRDTIIKFYNLKSKV